MQSDRKQSVVGAGHARDFGYVEAHSRARPAPTKIKKGIGETWADYPVLGATRGGLAAAKTVGAGRARDLSYVAAHSRAWPAPTTTREPPGKQPQRYKPVFCGTVFYNPMRILIGSIAFVDDDDEPGITSPDYVVLQGKAGLVDSRWFYYWLRSPYGEQCINSLARGAVRGGCCLIDWRKVRFCCRLTRNSFGCLKPWQR